MDLFQRFLGHSTQTMFVEVEPNGTIASANVAFARRADTTLDQLIDAPLALHLADQGQGVLRK